MRSRFGDGIPTMNNVQSAINLSICAVRLARFLVNPVLLLGVSARIIFICIAFRGGYRTTIIRIALCADGLLNFEKIFMVRRR